MSPVKNPANSKMSVMTFVAQVLKRSKRLEKKVIKFLNAEYRAARPLQFEAPDENSGRCHYRNLPTAQRILRLERALFRP